jgi:hypothetical protein
MAESGAKDVVETLDRFLRAFLEWLYAARHPTATCRRLLSISDSWQRLCAALRLCLISFIVSAVLYFPIYKLYGIDLGTLEFHLSNFLYLVVGVVACGFAFWAGFKIWGVSSTFADLTCVYTAYLACYQPLLALFSFLQEFQFVANVSAAKGRSLDIGQAAKYFLDWTVSSGSTLNFVNVSETILRWLPVPFLLAACALMARSISERYSVPRVKAISALSFATAVFVMPIVFAQAAATVFTVYAFVSPSGSLPPRP